MAGLSQGFSFSHRLAGDLDPVSIVDDAVHDGVGKSRGGEPVVPVGHRDLGDQEG